VTEPLIDPLTLHVSGKHYEQFADALTDAFPAYPALQQMVRFRLNQNLANYGGPESGLGTVAFNLIEDAKANGHFLRLIAAARESRPGNPKLAFFAQQFSLAAATPNQPQLESIIRRAHSFLDIAQWRERLGEIENRVCRIEVATNNGVTFGTGFLVGPDLVLTNYHVVEELGRGQVQSSAVTLLFDYKVLPGGTVNRGPKVGLLEIVDYSPYDPVDLEALPKSGEPQPENLDYALLRVESQGGVSFADSPIGSNPEPGAPPRGSIALPSAAGQPLAEHAPLFIVQHADAKPMKLALEMDSVIAVNRNGSRVIHKTNTLGGSSGSPCFNQNPELVALHHAGDPNYGPLYHAQFNEAIPIAAVLKLLKERNKAGGIMVA
jgi:hypothetical protein